MQDAGITPDSGTLAPGDSTRVDRKCADAGHDWPSTGPRAERTDLARLAAKARILEALSTGDVRVLAAELRAELEALAGPTAAVVPITRAKR